MRPSMLVLQSSNGGAHFDIAQGSIQNLPLRSMSGRQIHSFLTISDACFPPPPVSMCLSCHVGC